MFKKTGQRGVEMFTMLTGQVTRTIENQPLIIVHLFGETLSHGEVKNKVLCRKLALKLNTELLHLEYVREYG